MIKIWIGSLYELPTVNESILDVIKEVLRPRLGSAES